MKHRSLRLAMLACLAAPTAFAAPQYLRCPIDGRPNALGYDFLLDREGKTLSMVLPGSAPTSLPLAESATEYEARFDMNETPMLVIRINRFTLRFSVYNAIGKPEVTSGQCQLAEQKL